MSRWESASGSNLAIAILLRAQSGFEMQTAFLWQTLSSWGSELGSESQFAKECH